VLNVIDEFTREALAIEVGRSIDADGVVDVLDRLESPRRVRRLMCHQVDISLENWT
jgi:putative transposase